jgi:predicted protein tyrosine phosphatase
LLEGLPGYEARSVGTQPGARIVVTEGHIGWADLIIVMEKSHAAKLRQKFPDAVAGKRLVALHIPDDYGFMDAALLEELRGKLSLTFRFRSSDAAIAANTCACATPLSQQT